MTKELIDLKLIGTKEFHRLEKQKEDDDLAEKLKFEELQEIIKIQFPG